LPGFRM